MPTRYRDLTMLGAALIASVSAFDARFMSGQSSQAGNVPVKQVVPASARSGGTFGALLGLRQLPDGRVLINDVGKRKLIVLDSSLALSFIVLDSAGGANGAYGPRGAPLIPFTGDSTLFVDLAARVLLVIDPVGKISRTTTLPRFSDITLLQNGPNAGVDVAGRLVYRGSTGASAIPPTSEQTTVVTQAPDSAPIVRADFETRRTDTLGRVRTLRARTTQTFASVGGLITSFSQTVFPVGVVDEFAVVTDGSVAFIRGSDYHIDWTNANGTRQSTPRIPFDWRRLTDEDKQRMLDSARRFQDSVASRNAAPPSCNPGALCPTPRLEFVNARLDELPDYYPPFRRGSVQPDRDNNLWILPLTSSVAANNGLIYDVVNRKGELFQRVQIPAGRLIVGFGPGGVLYMQAGDLRSGFTLERTRVSQ